MRSWGLCMGTASSCQHLSGKQFQQDSMCMSRVFCTGKATSGNALHTFVETSRFVIALAHSPSEPSRPAATKSDADTGRITLTGSCGEFRWRTSKKIHIATRLRTNNSFAGRLSSAVDSATAQHQATQTPRHDCAELKKFLRRASEH